MNLDSLTHTSGEWLRGTGPESDIVISSRVRLARNLAAFPFTNRASGYQKAEVEAMLRERIGRLDVTPRLDYLHVPGLNGEGSRASGHFYQISNQVTLGKSEQGILNEIHSVIPQIITYERQARQSWLRDNRQGLQDKVSRAHGTLCSATMMTSEETMELLSYVRLGINLGLISELTILTINELFIQTQP